MVVLVLLTNLENIFTIGPQESENPKEISMPEPSMKKFTHFYFYIYIFTWFLFSYQPANSCVFIKYFVYTIYLIS